MHLSQIITLSLLALLIFWAVGAYNRLVKLRNDITNAFAQIDVQLKRRYDLIPNLVEVSRKYLEHEREILERLAAARSQVMAACDLVRARPGQAGPVKSLGLAEEVMDSALRGFSAVVESTPELKADAMLTQLNEELTHTENKVAFSRQLFNDATMEFNNAIEQFPTSLIAGPFGFRVAPMLQSTQNAAERASIKVSL
jgi:LemA protein